ncbi:MAG: hypothetical protein ACREJD_02625 [Phycisphaerales bacterium]
MKSSRGFALRDALFGTCALAALAAITVPALSQVRMDSGRQVCIGNYRFISATSGSYINDHAGRMWALDWKAGMPNPEQPGTYFGSDRDAQAYQAVSIYRRLSNLTPQESPVPASAMLQILNAHAALLDYLNTPLTSANVAAPASFMVCPEDWTRQNYLDGKYKPLPATGGDNSFGVWRWIFSSSYRWDVYQWSPSRTYRTLNPHGQLALAPMVFQTADASDFWNIEGDSTILNAWGPKQATEVRFPSSKVFLSDDYARHNGKPRYYAYQDAAQDLLFHDGSVRFLRSDSTNPGWNAQKRSTRSSMTTRFAHTKQSDVFGTVDNGAASANFAAGWYRWTRGGLYGWDVPRARAMVGKLPNPSVIENEVDTSAATGEW